MKVSLSLTYVLCVKDNYKALTGNVSPTHITQNNRLLLPLLPLTNLLSNFLLMLVEFLLFFPVELCPGREIPLPLLA